MARLKFKPLAYKYAKGFLLYKQLHFHRAKFKVYRPHLSH